ncbi:MAG: carbon storage regulator CsrA [Fibrobacteria bacterium]|nr:carbon storage regulator CsrA [Fibrobacteria bacterium]
MLVLTRKIGESIRINDNISITVMEIDGRSVKIAIDAPRSVPIHREEIFQRIQEENKSAAATSAAEDLTKIAGLFKKK